MSGWSRLSSAQVLVPTLLGSGKGQLHTKSHTYSPDWIELATKAPLDQRLEFCLVKKSHSMKLQMHDILSVLT